MNLLFSWPLTSVNHFLMSLSQKLCSCEFCGKGFSQNSDLTARLRIHTGVKLHTCKTCRKCLQNHSSVASHVRIYMWEKLHLEKKSEEVQLHDAIRKDRESPRRREAVFLLTARETVHSERQLEGPHEDSHGQEAVSCGMCGKSFRSSSNLPVDTRTTEWRTGKLPGGTPQSWNIKSQMMEKSSVTEMSITQSQSAVRGVMNAPTPCLGWILVWWQKPGQVSWQQLSLWADLVFFSSELFCVSQDNCKEIKSCFYLLFYLLWT